MCSNALFDAQKAGHAGTLDPLATGVLPVAFGEATKTMPYVMDGEKSYRFMVRWGQQTNTDDAQGEDHQNQRQSPFKKPILRRCWVIFSAKSSKHRQLFQPFTSRVSAPTSWPDAARTLSCPHASCALTICQSPHSLIKIIVNSRSIAEKARMYAPLPAIWVQKLACFGHVVELRRTRVGKFHESMSISLDKLRELSHSAADREALLANLLCVETALDDIPELAINANDAFRLKQGQSVLLRGANSPILTGAVYATLQGELIAIGEVSCGELKPTRVFNL